MSKELKAIQMERSGGKPVDFILNDMYKNGTWLQHANVIEFSGRIAGQSMSRKTYTWTFDGKKIVAQCDLAKQITPNPISY